MGLLSVGLVGNYKGRNVEGLPRRRGSPCEQVYTADIIRGTMTDVPHPRRQHHSVYVILLSKDVLYEPKFKRCNPHYDSSRPCVYVGMTGLAPDERFDKHKAGIKANKFVRLYGLRLAPHLYEFYNPMPYRGAQEMEVELAISLRNKGYGVWQG